MISRNENDIIHDWPMGFFDNPLVSIRCMTYNHARYITQALDSFLMQETRFPFEIIIHDDASTDNTQEIIREYYKRFPSIIKPIFQTENQYSKLNGRNYLRELVDGACNGKYIAWCEGDDYWLDSHKLQKQIDYLESNPDCSMVFNSANYVDGNSRVTFCDKKSKFECDFSVDDVIRGGGAFCSTPSLCIRAEYANYIYEFQKIANVGDYPLQITLALKGRVHYLPDIMSAYRVDVNNTNSWTNRVMNNKKKHMEYKRNEIMWLNKLNEETNDKYSKSISFRIFEDKCVMYECEEISYKELKKCYIALGLVDKLRAIKKAVAWILFRGT